MSLRSMTGFAQSRVTAGDTDIQVSIRSVNHRGLDIHLHGPSELDPFESGMRAVIKRFVARGHLDVRVQISPASPAEVLAADRSRLAAYIAAFRAATREFGLETPLDLNAALQLPGMLNGAVALQLPEGFGSLLEALLEQALKNLNASREQEGGEIGKLLLDRAAEIERSADEIDDCRDVALAAFQTRLRERLEDLLRSANLDPQRLAQEAAVLADRSDIAEEIERLRIHARQLTELLRNGGEAGKRLDFFLQEMNRETNTILSKTSGPGEQGLRITELAIGAKASIEKMREQALNLE